MRPTESFRQTMKILAAAYRTPIDSWTVLAYWSALGDLDPAWIAKAAKRAIRSDAQFMPRPGELRQAALEFRPRRYSIGAERPTAHERSAGASSLRDLMARYDFDTDTDTKESSDANPTA